MGLPLAGCEGAEQACLSVFGLPFVEDAGSYCLGEMVFFACLDGNTACGEAETIACGPDGGPPHWFPSTCIPEGWTECAPPTEDPVGLCGP